jgi:hypothetical protein
VFTKLTLNISINMYMGEKERVRERQKGETERYCGMKNTQEKYFKKEVAEEDRSVRS